MSRLPGLRRPPNRELERQTGATEQRLGRPNSAHRARWRSKGGAFRDFLSRLIPYEELSGTIEERTISRAAAGALALLATAATYKTLPAASEIRGGSFKVAGLEQALTVLVQPTADLVNAGKLLAWPFIALGGIALCADAYLAVRPRQPVQWLWVCLSQMAVGFVGGLSVLIVLGLVLANMALGLAAALAALAFGAIILGLALLVLAVILGSAR